MGFSSERVKNSTHISLVVSSEPNSGCRVVQNLTLFWSELLANQKRRILGDGRQCVDEWHKESGLNEEIARRNSQHNHL